jgi:dipeptidyl aminopeptidase/acylaminoacyl peptidase
MTAQEEVVAMSTASPRPVQPEDLLAIKTVADVQIAPDGSRIAYVLTTIDADQDETRSTIWVVSASGGEPVPFTRGPRRDSAPRWSPDGRFLAFLSDREGDRTQLYVMAADGGEPRRLTSLDRGAGPAVWSPDGSRIAFSAYGPVEPPPADQAARKRWEQRPRPITRAHYKDDGFGYTFDTRQHLFVVPLDGGEARQITDGDANDRGPAWSPDGRRIAFSRSRSGVADFNLTDLWVVDADGGNPRRLTETVGRANAPSWSPDGTTIACYGTDEQRDGSLGADLVRVWTVPAAGGEPRRLTGEYDRGAYLLPPPAQTPGPVWSADGATLTFAVSDAGNVHVKRVPAAGGAVETVVAGERQVTLISCAPAAGRLAFVALDPHNPGDVYTCRWDGGDERRLTRLNEALLAGLTLPRVERRTFPSPHGVTIEGWLVRPVGAVGPAPLLVSIHGGPHGFAGNVFPAISWYVLASRGWAVLALNPSGSGSYGQAFAVSLRGRWGEYDLPEQLAAIDALIAEGLVDGERLAVSGYSYGGYMTAWTIGHTDRFRAAVVGAPVTNLESFHGTSDIGLWFAPWEMNGGLFANRETYRRLSPVTYVDRVTTPTLILHGEADDRCPIGQGEEFYIGLIAAGKAPAEFVRYPGGSHGFLNAGRPSHRVDYHRRIVEWVERHTLAPAGARPPAAAVPAGDA